MNKLSRGPQGDATYQISKLSEKIFYSFHLSLFDLDIQI